VRAGNLYSTAMLQGCLIGMLTMRRVWGERGDSGFAPYLNGGKEK
jgi:presenilin-like A22 family membrane protease